MKNSAMVLTVAYATVCATGVAQNVPQSPAVISPGKPAEATTQYVSGAGLCQAHFDRDGRVDNVTMIRSTGSAALDEDAMRSARHNWQGRPESTVSVPVSYTAAPLKKGHVIQYELPAPEYPSWAGWRRFSGKCLLQVLFDAQGKATFATVVKSSGSQVIDDFTVRHALNHWRSSGGEESVLTFPVTYIYREQHVSNLPLLSVPGVQITP